MTAGPCGCRGGCFHTAHPELTPQRECRRGELAGPVSAPERDRAGADIDDRWAPALLDAATDVLARVDGDDPYDLALAAARAGARVVFGERPDRDHAAVERGRVEDLAIDVARRWAELSRTRHWSASIDEPLTAALDRLTAVLLPDGPRKAPR